MKQEIMHTVKMIAGIISFVGFLTISSELSRSQSEKSPIRPAWTPAKQILLAAAVPVPPRAFPFTKAGVYSKLREEKVKGRTAKPPTKTGQVPFPKLSPPVLLDHTELQAMGNGLEYEILPGRGVRFRFSEFGEDRMGHEWFLKKPRDLRGKTVRIDYLGYVPEEMTFRIAKSGRSAAVIKKVKVVDSPNRPRSIFIDIPPTVPFSEVRHLEFWFDRETAGRSYGDFMIEKVVVLG